MKLLIAEDDALIRDGLVEILRPEGFECVTASDGKQALIQYHEHAPDLLLLDIMMPTLDGYSVCREIRKNDAHTAVIFISAKSEEIDRVLGLELGADDYIMKPFGKHEVLARIKSVLRRYQLTPKAMNVAEHEFRIGDLSVSIDELRARRNDQVIELSVRDCKILHFLSTNRNKVITRDDLFNACWGRDYLPSSRTLDQHISKLRKLIEIDSSCPQIIQTVHGIGYRYQENIEN